MPDSINAEYVNLIGQVAAGGGARVAVDSSGRLIVTTAGGATWVFAEDSAASTGELGIPALVVRRDDDDAATMGANLDYGWIVTNSLGAVRTTLQAPVVSYYEQVTTNTTTDIVASPGAGNRIYITGLRIQQEATTATLVTYKDEDVTLGKVYLATNAGVGMDRSFSYPLRCTAGKAFQVICSVASTVGITVEYYTAAE